MSKMAEHENHGSFLQGLCMDMCPEHERNLREKQRRLHPFELASVELAENMQNNEMVKTTKANIVVKEFSRPAAGKELDPRDLRPAPVLVKTMDYLLTYVLNKPNPWYYKCDFISDRIRSVRQDLTAQNIQSFEAIDILQKAARYYLIMAVKLCKEPLEKYDPVLHYTHTKECLRKLLELYRVHNSSYSAGNQGLFEACYLLLNLGNPEAYQYILKLHVNLRKCKEVERAIHLTKLHLNGNFIGVFRAASELSYLESCALFCHIRPIRCQGLSIMNMAFSSKNLHYPLSLLAKNFYFDSNELAAKFCKVHGINVEHEKVFFNKGQFIEPEQHEIDMCHKLTGSKLKTNISNLICDI